MKYQCASRSEYEDIVLSQEKLQDYIDAMMPGYYLKKITGDGLCIISSFKEGLKAVGKEVTTEFLLQALRSEILQKFDFYKGFCREDINILLELDSFLKNPLMSYNSDACDTFLLALGNALKCKTVILQSSTEKCWTVDLNEADDDEFAKTLYFARSISDHFDAVIPINSTKYADSDSDIEIVKVVEKDYKPIQVKSEKYVHSDGSDDDISIIKVMPSTANISKKIKVEDEEGIYSTQGGISYTEPDPMEEDSSSMSSQSDNYGDEDNVDADNEDCANISRGRRVLSKETWKRVIMQSVESIPQDIDNLVSYSVMSTSRISLLAKCRDGRPWKPDTRTSWAGYENVRYRDCAGSPICPNSECPFKKEFGGNNRLRFDRSRRCTLCGALGNNLECNARKYIAFRGQGAHIFHVGKHTCVTKPVAARPVALVAQSMAVNPGVKPSAIQGNAILTEMRKRKPWSEVEGVVKKVANKRAISNEKLKQKRQMQPHGASFRAVAEYKRYTDEKDTTLIYDVDDNKQLLFKTSKAKMKVANQMQFDSDHILAEEYCGFDGKVHRTKDYTTLTASVYHPLLQRQMPMAIMECKSEDSTNIESFWRLFNQAFREVNDREEKFMPKGWTTDMATANFNGLERIYGEDVRTKIKGCEFHFQASIKKHSAGLGDDSAQFKNLANELLVSSTKESYEMAYSNMKTFIDIKDERSTLLPWLTWWNDRREFIFRAFTGYTKPRSNLAEVVHASWTNRDAKGLSLLESAEFDTRDSLILEAQIYAISNNAGGFCEGPSLAELARRREMREQESASKKGQDLLDHGVHFTENGEQWKLPTIDPSGGANPPKTAADNTEKMFLTRSEAAANLAETMKIRKEKKISLVKRQYSVTSSTSGKKLYDVIIANTPSCTCPDFQRRGSKVVCKHILFIVQIVLSGNEVEEQLKARYFNDEDLKTMFTSAGNIDLKFMQESNPVRKRKDFDAILKDHACYNAQQTWKLHMKKARSAQCTAYSCKKVLPKGTECFSVDGALSVPYNGNKAVGQSFYFCAARPCIQQRPPWTNIREPNCFAADDMIGHERKTELAENLGLVMEI